MSDAVRHLLALLVKEVRVLAGTKGGNEHQVALDNALKAVQREAEVRPVDKRPVAPLFTMPEGPEGEPTPQLTQPNARTVSAQPVTAPRAPFGPVQTPTPNPPQPPGHVQPPPYPPVERFT